MALAAVKREMKERQFHAKKAVLGQAHSGHGGAAFLEGSAGQHEALQELLLVSLSTDGNGEGCAPWGRVAAPHCPHTVSSPKEWESKGTPHPPPHLPPCCFPHTGEGIASPRATQQCTFAAYFQTLPPSLADDLRNTWLLEGAVGACRGAVRQLTMHTHEKFLLLHTLHHRQCRSAL